MDYTGLDISLTRFAYVTLDEGGNIKKFGHFLTKLSLESSISEIIHQAIFLTNGNLGDDAKFFIDVSRQQFAYPGGKLQKGLTGLFLGAIMSQINATPVSPYQIREHKKLPLKAAKAAVHVCYNVPNGLPTEDVRDAYCLAVWGLENN